MEYNPSTKQWNQYYDHHFSGGVCFVINNKAYLFQSFAKYAADPSSVDEKFWELQP